MLAGANLEEDGYMRRKVQCRCARCAGRGRKTNHRLQIWDSVSHPRVEKSAFQEIYGNSGFATGEERVFEDCCREESALASASCERFLEHRSYSFRFAHGYDDTY
jgi:hypothetical protein